MISDAAVKAIQDSVETKEILISGESYTTREVFIPPDDPLPDVLTLHTLTGLVDFINVKASIGVEAIHVLSCTEVRVIGSIEGRTRKRPVYVRAVVAGSSKFRFDQYLPAEDFVIGLQSGFVDSDGRKQVLSLAGNLRDEAVQQVGDDGVTQTVTVRKGVSLAQAAVVPNPVFLAPYRTFGEIEQPESPFIFRVKRKDGELPQVALFETADRGWELKAIKLIRQFLQDAMPDVPIIA